MVFRLDSSFQCSLLEKKQGIRKRVRPAKERIFRKEEGHVEVMLLAILQLKPLVIKKKLNDESKW